jgi:predicted dehydrogenase
MIKKEEPAITVIATESGYHAEIALWCIDAEVPCIIIEKPIALSMADADKIIRRSEEKGTLVCANHQNRFNMAVQSLRSALHENRFGIISHAALCVRWRRDKEYFGQDWRGTWDLDGGCLMNQCIHGIDLLRWLLGSRVSEIYGVTARRLHPYIEAEDIGMAILRFESGVVATLEGTTNVFPDNLEQSLSIFGEKGTVKLGGLNASTVELWQFEDGHADATGVQEKSANEYGNGHTRLYADVIDALKNHRPLYVDARAGREALETVLAVYKSAHIGVPIKLPLTDCASSEFKGRFG